MQTSAEAGSTKRAKTTRQVGPDSFEWLLAEDKVRENRKRELVDSSHAEGLIDLGRLNIRKFNPVALGPNLKRKFLDENSNARACMKLQKHFK